MLRTIYKYTFDVRELLGGYLPLKWTSHSKVVHSKYDDNTQEVTLWIELDYLVDDDGQRQFPFIKSHITAVGTGWPIPEYSQHLCSVITDTGDVWHVFKVNNIIGATQ